MARLILLLLLLPPDLLVLADDAIIDIEPLHGVAKNETLAQLIAGHPKVKMNKSRLEKLEAQRKHRNKKSEEKARVKEERREKAMADLEAKLVRLGNKQMNFLAALDGLCNPKEILGS